MRAPSFYLHSSCGRTRQALFPVLLAGALLAVLSSGCGEPNVEAASASINDVSQGDAAGVDCCEGDGGAGSSDAGSVWHQGPDAGVEFTGQGQIEVEPDKQSFDMRKMKLTMFQTKQPEKGKVYVWWMRSPSNKSENFGTLPYEDTPYAADFLVQIPDPADGSAPFIANFNGAYITYEDEVGAEKLSQPVGPIVWKGEIPLSAWVHVQHVLTRRDGAGNKPGYIQQAAVIMKKVLDQIKILRQGVKAGKAAAAITAAENIHTLLVGESNAKDISGDKSFAKDLSEFKMGLAAGDTPLNGAVKHAKIAKAAADDAGLATPGLTQGFAALEDAAKGFNAGMGPALEALEAFASGSKKEIKDVDDTMNQLSNRFSAAMLGARKLGQIDLAK